MAEEVVHMNAESDDVPDLFKPVIDEADKDKRIFYATKLMELNKSNKNDDVFPANSQVFENQQISIYKDEFKVWVTQDKVSLDAHVQFSESMREKIFELTKKGSYHRYVYYPVELKEEEMANRKGVFEVMQGKHVRDNRLDIFMQLLRILEHRTGKEFTPDQINSISDQIIKLGGKYDKKINLTGIKCKELMFTVWCDNGDIKVEAIQDYDGIKYDFNVEGNTKESITGSHEHIYRKEIHDKYISDMIEEINKLSFQDRKKILESVKMDEEYVAYTIPGCQKVPDKHIDLNDKVEVTINGIEELEKVSNDLNTRLLEIVEAKTIEEIDKVMKEHERLDKIIADAKQEDEAKAKKINFREFL